jgi:hypothetical protein
MCWLCNNQDYLLEVEAIVAEYGHFVQGVTSDGILPCWAYTVGLTRRGLAELFLIGLPFDLARPLLNAVVERFPTATPAPGSRIRLPGPIVLMATEVAGPRPRLHVAQALYGPSVTAMRLVSPDIDTRGLRAPHRERRNWLSATN